MAGPLRELAAREEGALGVGGENEAAAGVRGEEGLRHRRAPRGEVMFVDPVDPGGGVIRRGHNTQALRRFKFALRQDGLDFKGPIDGRCAEKESRGEGS